MFNKSSRAVSVALSIVAAFVFAFTAASSAQAETVMTHHLHAPLVGSKAIQPIGKLPSTQVLTLDVVLPLRDPQGLLNFITLVNDPSSPSYRQFLTPTQFAAMFGPSQADYDTLVSFLKANGFEVYGGTYLGHEVQVHGTVAAIESTFHVSMNVYQHPTESRTFYSPDREPTVNLPFPLWHITGLNNYSIPHPLYVKREDVAKAKGVSPASLTPNATTGSGPSASFLGSDMRAAYYTSGGGTLDGTGQNVGLWEYEGTDVADLVTYYTNVGQTLVQTVANGRLVIRSSDGTTTTCIDNKANGNCDDGEQTLDMTQILGMAPQVATMTMYIGSNDTPIIADMATHNPLPSTIGCSWGWTPDDPATLDPYWEQMIAQGQNFFAASGDSSTWSKNNEAWPADDTYVTSVGGTDLTTASAAGPWKAETAWTDSGGGITPDKIALPSYQNIPQVIAAGNGNGASTTLRNGPDVAANANFTFYTCADQTTCLANEYGGTSFAAPMWAGYIALVNQGIAASSTNVGNSLGFLNTLIYSENQTASTYAANFHDITSGKSGTYSAEVGFDLVTGWGSPTTALATTLIGTPIGTPGIYLTAPVLTYTGQSNTTNITTELDTTSRNGFTGNITYTCVGTGGLTCTGLPVYNMTTPNFVYKNTSMVINTSGVTAKGTYTVTVTATSGSVSSVALVYTVTISTVTANTFTVTPATTSYTIANFNPIVDNVAVASVGTFAGTVALTCTPTGVLTCSIAPASETLTAGSTSTPVLTINTTGATAGTYTVTVKGVSGATTVQATVTVIVPASSFTLTPATTSYTLTNFNPIADNVVVAGTGLFTGTVALSCSGNGGLTCSMNPTSEPITTIGGSGTSVATIVTSGATTPGTYTVTVTGVSGTTTVTSSITVIVPPSTFTLVPTTAAYSIASGTPETDTITATGVGLFAGTINYTCTPSGGITCSFSPLSDTLTVGGSGTTVLSLNTGGVTALGSYPITVTGTSGSTVVTTTVTVNITSLLPPAFTIVPNTYTLAIASIGGSATDPLTLNANATFSGTVNLVCGITSTPANVTDVPTCSVAPASAVLPAGGSVTGPVVTIGTTAAHFKSGGLHSSLETRRVEWLAGGLFLALLLFPLRRRRLPLLAVVLTVLLLSGSLIGCVNYNQPPAFKGTDPGTTLGTYTITVVGTPGNTTSSPVEEANITLTVN